MRNCAALVIDEALVRRIVSFFFFLWPIVTDTDPGWSEAAFGSTHPVTTDIVDHTREYRVSALGNSHVFQWEQKIWLETVHWNIQQQYMIIIDNGHLVVYYIKSRKVFPQQIEKKNSRDYLFLSVFTTSFSLKSHEILNYFSRIFFVMFDLSRSK